MKMKLKPEPEHDVAFFRSYRSKEAARNKIADYWRKAGSTNLRILNSKGSFRHSIFGQSVHIYIITREISLQSFSSTAESLYSSECHLVASGIARFQVLTH